jgi:serine/threonine protein kinase
MTSEHWRQIEELYHSARECDPGKRAALLAEAEPEIRAQVERMLALDFSGDRFPDHPAADPLEKSTEVILGAGSQIGPYKIVGVLGSGGMGKVYRALDTRLHRNVAIKISAERFSGRFEREARAIAALNHPHICTVHDVGPNYLVMELVEGETLATRLRKRKLTLDLVVQYGAQIADALAAAHANGITHRDLKPGNIMLAKNGVKILDFGLAKAPGEPLTASKVIMGTPGYMAPEQLEGKPCDARTDIFALGLVLQEMATGKREQGTEGLPAQLVHVIQRCVAKDPEDRWQSVRDVKAELEWAEKSFTPAPAASARRTGFY